jgi:hypothetical protein
VTQGSTQQQQRQQHHKPWQQQQQHCNQAELLWLVYLYPVPAGNLVKWQQLLPGTQQSVPHVARHSAVICCHMHSTAQYCKLQAWET